MNKKTTSTKSANSTEKSISYHINKLKNLWKKLQLTPSDQGLIEELEQLILYFSQEAKQLDKKSYLEVTKKFKQLNKKTSKTKISKAQQKKVNKIIQMLRKSGARETDQLNSAEDNPKPLYFFAGQHSKDNKQLLQKLLQFNIDCTWLTDKELTNAKVTSQPSLFIFESNLLNDDGYADLLNKRATEKNQINIALYRQPFPAANIRAKVLKAGAELVDFYDFPGIIKTLHQKSHTKKDSEINLFMLLCESQTKTNLQQHLESSAFNLLKFKCIEHLLDALNNNQADAILVAPSAYNDKQLPISPLVKQQSTQIHLPIININTGEVAQNAKHFPIIATQVNDNCNFALFRKSLLKQLEHAELLSNLISQDRLTGLYTHSFFLNTARMTLKKADEKNKTLIMLDIDHFKKVNDLYGHQIGDSVIQNLSLYLKQHLRHKDPIGRYGGEEFAILLDTDENQALSIIDKIRAGFAEFEHANTKPFKVTFSCGLAPYTNQGLKKLVKQADEALYKAKQSGRNCCKIYTPKKP